MLEKQLTGHRVDRSICAWYWDHAISQGDQVHVLHIFISQAHFRSCICSGTDALGFSFSSGQITWIPFLGVFFSLMGFTLLFL